MMSCSKELNIFFFLKICHDDQSKNYNSNNSSIKEMLDLNFELCPLHSPLLRTSKFISFPPVIEML